MISSYAQLPDLIISSGTAVSNVYNGVWVTHDAVGLIIYSPAVAPESVTIEVNPNQTALTSDAGWVGLQSYLGGVLGDVVTPAAGKAQVYQEPVFAGSMRLKSSTNVAADRVFKVTKIWTT